MAYFSRLSDIVTCNLNDLLEKEQDPSSAILSILQEIEAGVAGANRSVTTAASNLQQIQNEIEEHRRQVTHWKEKAREELSTNREEAARRALVRKREVEDLIAGLDQQYAAAVATREQLETTRRALEARLAEARRLNEEFRRIQSGSGTSDTVTYTLSDTKVLHPGEVEAIKEEIEQRDPVIEDELAALKRELEEKG